jgi:hypothetical protein
MSMSESQYAEQIQNALSDAGNRLAAAQAQYAQASGGAEPGSLAGGESQSQANGTLYVALCRVTGVQAEVAALNSAPA